MYDQPLVRRNKKQTKPSISENTRRVHCAWAQQVTWRVECGKIQPLWGRKAPGDAIFKQAVSGLYTRLWVINEPHATNITSKSPHRHTRTLQFLWNSPYDLMPNHATSHYLIPHYATLYAQQYQSIGHLPAVGPRKQIKRTRFRKTNSDAA